MEQISSTHYKIIDILKGICILWVIMLHAIPSGGRIYKLLLMPFYAQLTIPFFMTLSGFTYALSFEKHRNWYSLSNLWRKVKRFIFPFVPALILEVIVMGKPENILTWLLAGGYQMPGSYYVILMIQLVVFFPLIYSFYYHLHTKNNCSWILGILVVFILQCLYELLTYLIDLNVQIYRLLIFRYFIFLYMGIALYKAQKENKIFWKSMVKLLPFGFLYIFFVGYMNWQPEVLFRYPTWYRSAAPVIFWVAPIIAYFIADGNLITNRLETHEARCFISDKVQLLGQASYHIYIVQMLWFGLIIFHVNSDSWRKLIICVISMVVCSVVGVIYFYVHHWCHSRITRKISRAKNQDK